MILSVFVWRRSLFHLVFISPPNRFKKNLFSFFSFLPFSILKLSVHYFVAYVVFNLQPAVLFIFIPLHITCLYVPPIVVFHIFSLSLTLSFLIMMCLSFLHVFLCLGFMKILGFFCPYEFIWADVGMGEGFASKRRCWGFWQWSLVCAVNSQSVGAAGTWSWSCGTAWPLTGHDLFHVYDLGWMGLCAVLGPHVMIALSDSTHSGQVPVYPVHMDATVGIVEQLDANVLYLQGRFLKYLPTVDHFFLKTSSAETMYQKQDLAMTWLGTKIGMW